MKFSITRRDFLSGALLTGGALGLDFPLAGRASETQPLSVQGSHARETLRADVLVIGAGSAGVPAALAAARAGARVILVEEDRVPGGQPVDMYVASPCGGPRLGIYREMLDRLNRDHNISLNPKVVSGKEDGWYLPSSYVAVIMSMLGGQKDKLQLICGARAVGVLVTEGMRNRVRGVEIERQNGQRQIIEARCTIDASGTGIVAEMGGFQTMYGREARGDFNEPFGPETADKRVQHCTWMFITQQVRKGPAMDFTKTRWFPNESGYGWLSRKSDEHSRKSGTALEIATQRNSGIYLHWGSSVVCEDTRDPVCLAQTQMEAYSKIESDLQTYMANGYAVWLAPKLGVRETRRVRGEHVITVNDLRSGRLPDDVVAISTYGLDAWGEKIPKEEQHLPRSGIPYRALIPKDAEGLLIACKSISGTHLAASSYRVQPVMASVGTAAGVAAALAAQKQTGVRDVPLGELQQRLKTIGTLPA